LQDNNCPKQNSQQCGLFVIHKPSGKKYIDSLLAEKKCLDYSVIIASNTSVFQLAGIGNMRFSQSIIKGGKQ
jgi:hypothetical protein